MNTGFPGSGDGIAGLIMAGVIIIFAIVIIGFIFKAVKGVSEWSHNNSQPVLIAPAKVVTKRTNVTHHHHHHSNHTHDTSSTQYFATFELEQGERMEFQISGRESGLLAEGDAGELTYQGTRYKGFQRRVVTMSKLEGSA